MEHLAELRSRIFRSLIFICAGTVLSWFFYGIFFHLLTAPVGRKLLITGIAEGFIIKMQVSLVLGLIVSAPFVAWQGWAFVAPGLTSDERRHVVFAVPLSVFLFWAGIVAGYVVLPPCIGWLAEQNPPDAVFMPNVKSTILFILWLCLAFGIVFQLPVLLIFLAKIGLVNSKFLKTHWRYAILLISIVAAIGTPTNDPFTFVMMFVPMCLLYFVSIWLVKLVEKK